MEISADCTSAPTGFGVDGYVERGIVGTVRAVLLSHEGRGGFALAIASENLIKRAWGGLGRRLSSTRKRALTGFRQPFRILAVHSVN
jgi:hypothetical protein